MNNLATSKNQHRSSGIRFVWTCALNAVGFAAGVALFIWLFVVMPSYVMGAI